MEYKFVIYVKADSEGEAENKLNEMEAEDIKDNLNLEI